VAFRILRQKLTEKYGAEEAAQRIFATTDRANGTLRALADAIGYETFTIPDDIGGRFSVLSSVGLLPIAAAGIDTDELLAGAKDAAQEQIQDGSAALQYATIRNILYEKNYGVEVLSTFEPSFAAMNEWWKQLFGESEGKSGQGILPDSMIFTTDLHSLGQYVQDGKKQLFETCISFQNPPVDVTIPADPTTNDGLEFLAGQSLDIINQKACQATLSAHASGDVPVLNLILPAINAREVGYFIYFMEFACAVSAYILGVNPFNQPGVEVYKTNMYALIDKPE
jgi:glucose-6-phosphate isomerase